MANPHPELAICSTLRHRRPGAWHRAAVLLLVVAFLGAGCGGDATETASETPDTTGQVSEGAAPPNSVSEDSVTVDEEAEEAESEPPADAPSSAPRATPSDWSTEPVRVTHDPAEVPTVTDMRTGRHESYDRVVIEFGEAALPGYTVRYLNEAPVECGSGRPVDLAGSRVLEIHLEPARGHSAEGTATVDHGKQVHGFEAIKETEIACDFEAVFTSLLGVDRRAPFRIQELSDPPRLVVDVQHDAP